MNLPWQRCPVCTAMFAGSVCSLCKTASAEFERVFAKPEQERWSARYPQERAPMDCDPDPEQLNAQARYEEQERIRWRNDPHG